MGAAVNQHILQTVDWTRFDLEGWLYQFGAWIYSASGRGGRSVNPIAVAMDSAVKAQKLKKLNKQEQQQIIADYLTGDFEPLKPKRTRITCQIDDNEIGYARAVRNFGRLAGCDREPVFLWGFLGGDGNGRTYPDGCSHGC